MDQKRRFARRRSPVSNRTRLTGHAMPMSAVTRGSAAPTVMPTQEPNDMPPLQIARHVRISRRHEVEGGAKVLLLAGTSENDPGTSTDAAEVETQHRHADARQSLCRVDTRLSYASCRPRSEADGRAPRWREAPRPACALINPSSRPAGPGMSTLMTSDVVRS